jgi:hypothetical protein
MQSRAAFAPAFIVMAAPEAAIQQIKTRCLRLGNWTAVSSTAMTKGGVKSQLNDSS